MCALAFHTQTHDLSICDFYLANMPEYVLALHESWIETPFQLEQQHAAGHRITACLMWEDDDDDHCNLASANNQQKNHKLTQKSKARWCVCAPIRLLCSGCPLPCWLSFRRFHSFIQKKQRGKEKEQRWHGINSRNDQVKRVERAEVQQRWSWLRMNEMSTFYNAHTASICVTIINQTEYYCALSWNVVTENMRKKMSWFLR